MAAIPVSRQKRFKALSDGLPAPTLTRRTGAAKGVRARIEVRGLDGPGGTELGRAVVDAVRVRPGVTSASLNRPLSRLVITLNGDQTSLRELCNVVDEAEKRCSSVDTTKRQPRPDALPGDGLLPATKAVGVGATAVGVGAAVAGRVLRWPPLTYGFEAAVVAVDYQPRVRRLLEESIGQSATDTLLSLAMTAAHVLELSPASLAVDLMMETLKAAEMRAKARLRAATNRRWPAMPNTRRSTPRPAQCRCPRGPSSGTHIAAHWFRRSVSEPSAPPPATSAWPRLRRWSPHRKPPAPPANRSPASLGQGLADQHAVLALHPQCLRRLDRVDALLVDPRVLCTDTLRVVRVRGADEDEIADPSAAWDAAAQLLQEKRGLRVGWHPVAGVPDVEALVGPTHDPLASAVLAEARRADLDLISVEIDDLGELRPAFDELRAAANESIDDALVAALSDLQQSGHTVAVLSSAAAQALSSADVGLPVMPNSDAEPPPWTADLMLSDLAGAWRLLHAVPAAKTASRRGIGVSTGATALGALLMVPGVRGQGPGPVTTGAAAGLLSGYLLARRVVRAPTPLPAPIHEWHAMSVEQVRKMLPPPESRESTAPHHGLLATRAMETAYRRGRADRTTTASGLAVRQGGPQAESPTR